MGLISTVAKAAHKDGRQFLYINMNHSKLCLDDITGGNDQMHPAAFVVIKCGHKLSCFLFDIDIWPRKEIHITRVPDHFDWKVKYHGYGALTLPKKEHMYLSRSNFENFRAYCEAQSNYEDMFNKDGTLK